MRRVLSKLALAGALICGLIGAGTVCAASSSAQSSDPGQPSDSAPADPAGSGALAEVIVTARRRAEVLQNVPISITSVKVSDLQVEGIDSLDALQLVVPSLNTEQQRDRDSALPSIRGVKSNEISPDQQKVETLYDGLPVLGEQSVTQFVDIQSVSVYRGPQSAEFGRSVFAGAINYISMPASLTKTSAFTDATYGTDGLASGDALYTGPIIPGKLGVLVAVHQDNYDGPGNFDGPGTVTSSDAVKLGGTKTRYMSAKLAFEPVDWIHAELRYQHLDTYDEPSDQYDLDPTAAQFALLPKSIAPLVDPLTSARIVVGRINFTPPPTAFDRNFCFQGNAVQPTPSCITNPYNRLNRNRYTATLQFDTGGGGQLSIRAYSSYELQLRRDDSDRSNLVPYLNTVSHRVVNTVNDEYDVLPETEHYAEMVWLSPSDKRLRASVGASYYWYDFGTNLYFNVDPDVLAQVFSDDTRNKAVYGSLQYDLTHALTLSIEGRLQADTVIGYNVAAAPAIETSTTTNSFLPRFSATYKVNPALSVYAQVAKGDDPGGNNPDALSPVKQQLAAAAGTGAALDSFLHYKEETLWNYEVGAKGSLFDRHLVYAVDVYYLDWNNYQNVTNFQIATPGSFPAISNVPPQYGSRVTFNEGSLHGQGLEFSGTYQPNRILAVDFSYAHDKMQYADACSPTITQFGFALERTSPYPCVNVDGHQEPLNPQDTIGLGLRLTTYLSADKQWTNELRGYYLGRQYIDDTNLDWVAAKTTINFDSVLAKGHASLKFFVNNLTDNRSPVAVGAGAGAGARLLESNFNLTGNAGQTGIQATVAPPREYGLTATYHF